MRFMEHESSPEYLSGKSKKKEPKVKKDKPKLKAGNEGYDYNNLATTKKILTGRGSL